jgi:hypothetical protein
MAQDEQDPEESSDRFPWSRLPEASSHRFIGSPDTLGPVLPNDQRKESRDGMGKDAPPR